MHGRTTTLGDALRLVGAPIAVEKKRILAERWASLDPRWRVVSQGFGRQATGCGATIGVHPRCDFDCEGCYLGSDANRMPRRDHAEVVAQLRALRAFLGPKGNVQITDGEVTLLPAEDLIAILRSAREPELVPMVMSHGDTFRRKPGLLPRLVAEGGLTELSIHVDTLQRGRLGYKGAKDERELMPLRDEFAAMVREVRRSTGVKLRGAATMTIARENLDGVPPVVDWCLRNRDVFGMISFQPLAQVGRTKEGLGGVTQHELWGRIAEALAPYGHTEDTPGPILFGHPDCSRLLLMAVHERNGEAPRVASVFREGIAEDEDVLSDFHRRGLDGINFRDDTVVERACRAAGIVVHHAGWLAGPARRFASGLLRRLGTSPARLASDLAFGRAWIGGFSVVSHHFMSRDEIRTATGKDRLAACAFRLPVDGRMVSMCEVNAAGVREAFYARRSVDAPPPSSVPIFSTS